MVTWFAGLFYLPRLFVYHASATDEVSMARFKVMERKLFFGIMTPGGVLTLASGAWLWLGYGISGGWLHTRCWSSPIRRPTTSIRRGSGRRSRRARG